MSEKLVYHTCRSLYPMIRPDHDYSTQLSHRKVIFVSATPIALFGILISFFLLASLFWRPHFLRQRTHSIVSVMSVREHLSTAEETLWQPPAVSLKRHQNSSHAATQTE